MRAYDPIFDSQRSFRALLLATARPGEICHLPEVGDAQAHELALMALLDHEVSFAVVGEGAQDAQDVLLLLTESRTAPLSEADFVLVLGGDSRGGLSELKRGTLEEPEVGAAAVYAVGEISDLAPLVLRLSGPGVPGERTVGIKGLANAEVEAIQEARAHYPLGVDVYLVSREGSVLGLPRSTQIEVMH